MITEIVTLMARWKSCQPRMHPIRAMIRGGAINTGQAMNLFREQIVQTGCLSDCLSGNGQKLLNAPIPAPGGDQ
jgi:hypothetical protein